MKLYIAMMLGEKIFVEKVGMCKIADNNFGMVGTLPVFRTEKDALEYAGGNKSLVKTAVFNK